MIDKLYIKQDGWVDVFVLLVMAIIVWLVSGLIAKKYFKHLSFSWIAYIVIVITLFIISCIFIKLESYFYGNIFSDTTLLSIFEIFSLVFLCFCWGSILYAPSFFARNCTDRIFNLVWWVNFAVGWSGVGWVSTWIVLALLYNAPKKGSKGNRIVQLIYKNLQWDENEPNASSINAKSNLIKKLGQYKKCCRDKDYIYMSTLVFPNIVEELGGVEAFVETMRSVTISLEEQGLTMDLAKLEIGKPSKIIIHDEFLASVIPTKQPVLVQGIKGVINSSLIAFSSDEGDTWFFLEGSDEGKMSIASKSPGLLQKTDIPMPKLKFGDVTLIQKNGQWVKQ